MFGMGIVDPHTHTKDHFCIGYPCWWMVIPQCTKGVSTPYIGGPAEQSLRSFDVARVTKWQSHKDTNQQWIGLKEKSLPETMALPIKYRGFL